jgi:hypothetical protein
MNRTVRAKRLYKIKKKKNLNNDYVTFSCVHRHTHTHICYWETGPLDVLFCKCGYGG